MSDLVIVKAKIKDVAQGGNVAGDLAEALDKEARRLVEDAVKRADANNRKTIMAKDVPGSFTSGSANAQLVVKAKVKDLVSGHNVAGDFADGLNAVLNERVRSAARRANGNDRKTVMAKDL